MKFSILFHLAPFTVAAKATNLRSPIAPIERVLADKVEVCNQKGETLSMKPELADRRVSEGKVVYGPCPDAEEAEELEEEVKEFEEELEEAEEELKEMGDDGQKHAWEEAIRVKHGRNHSKHDARAPPPSLLERHLDAHDLTPHPRERHLYYTTHNIFQIDCYHSSYGWAGTDDDITVKFKRFDGTTEGQETAEPMCGSLWDSRYSAEVDAGDSMHWVDVTTSGGDAFFIDEAWLFRESGRGEYGKLHYGADGGSGWCLSNDTGDWGGKCYKQLRFTYESSGWMTKNKVYGWK